MIPAVGSIQNESAFSRGNAMSGAPIMSGITKFAMPANTGMMNRKIISEACTREQPVEGVRVHELRARLRQLGAHDHRHQPAEDEEEEGGDDVLDPDHLVIGVHPEVVLPGVGAVARVVLGDRGSAGGPAEPVVEAADADDEGERHGDQRHRGDGVPVEHRVPAVERADAAATSAEREERTRSAGRSRPGTSRAPGALRQVSLGLPLRPRREGTSRACRSPQPKAGPCSRRACARRRSSARGRRSGSRSRSSRTPRATGPPACRTSRRRLREVVEGRADARRRTPASASVWQALQPVSLKSVLPAAATSPPCRRRTAVGRALALLGDPGVELARRDHAHVLAHGGVADAAQLRAHHLVARRARSGVTRTLVVMPGHGVGLQAELGHPEGVDHVLGLHPELDAAALREHELVRLDLALPGVVEAPRELLARSRSRSAGSVSLASMSSSTTQP